MRIFFLGDVVGRAGRAAIMQHMPQLRTDWELDFVIVNAENAAGGFGITRKICDELFGAGVDVITSGNHIWDQAEILTHIAREPRLLRPLNYPANAPGQGAGLFTVGTQRVLVLNAQGQLFMEACDDPFAAVDGALADCTLGKDVDAIVLDFHAETGSETQAMGYFCDGRVSLVAGTHTHVPTADARLLPDGTAFQTDVGMCGDYESVLGFRAASSVPRWVTKRRSTRLEPAMGEATLCGALLDTDDKTGLAKTFAPIRIGGCLAAPLPRLVKKAKKTAKA